MKKEIKMKDRTMKFGDKEVNYKVGSSSIIEECTPWRAPRSKTHYDIIEVKVPDRYNWHDRTCKFVIFRDHVNNRVKFSLYFSVEDYIKGAPPIIDCGTKKECLQAALKTGMVDSEYYTRVSCLVNKHNEAEKYKGLYQQALAALKTIKVLTKNGSSLSEAADVVKATGLVDGE